MSRYPVLRGQYAAFLKATGHALPADWEDPAMTGDSLPVGGVSWEDAAAYCEWLSRATGTRYRLPATDEWEKAARGGLTGRRFPWGDESPAGRCCFGRPGEAGPEPVGSYGPNGYGLFDMVGGVWEWTADLYTDVAGDAPVNAPTGRPVEENRVLVGGSFMTPNEAPLWVAYRHEDPPDLRHRCIGFRVVRDA
jgi:formylglycine-generating enzyme required for sulfatase activity